MLGKLDAGHVSTVKRVSTEMNDSLEHPTLSPGGGSIATADPEGRGPGSTTRPKERRQRNQTLRKLVDGLLEHVRDLSDLVDGLSPEELEAEHERFNWIAELTWAAITDEKKRPGRRAEARRTG